MDLVPHHFYWKHVRKGSFNGQCGQEQKIKNHLTVVLKLKEKKNREDERESCVQLPPSM